METSGALPEGDWCSLGSMFLYQEADFMANFLALPTQPYEYSSYAVQPTIWPSHESAMSLSEAGDREFCSFDAAHHTSLWSGDVSMDDCIAFGFLPTSGSGDPLENVTHGASGSSETRETNEGNSSYLIGADDSPCRDATGGDESNEDTHIQIPWGTCDSAEIVADKSKKSTNSSDKSRKRFHSSEVGNARNVRRKNQKPNLPGKINAECRALAHDQGSTFLSEGDSSSPRELSENLPNISSSESAGVNLNCKTRATRGTATDPQSLYARKRRERINERLRILQKLVPNGTKVDISTMLEEAVHYVKFLQLQIRMLSSDELWMYAPISYNGTSIGFDWNSFKSR
ncbi:hypothetical protein MLD38_013758 [Melastoma candidum]|uniref:Uncharacterized protein n=1 Tax=Melastoma candidum TaxID=119954 RepID=A0ACB9RES2_9MYRT|nr:hypothetical protein MLD38_013758 [Melastoma candidum]